MANLSDVVKAGFDEMNRGNFGQVFAAELGSMLQAHMVEMRGTYADLSYQLNSTIETGNKVAFQWTGTGTHGTTGRQVSWTGSGVAHVLNGRIRSIKVNSDQLSRDIQLGTMPRVGFGVLGGAWRGKVLGVVVDIDMNHDDDGIWGDVQIENVGESTLTGTANSSGVQFSVKLPGGEVASFKGAATTEDMIQGTIDGFDGIVTFSRS